MTLTGLTFMIAFVAALILALARHPIYGLYAYVAEFYLDPPSRWWGAFLPDLRWSLLAAGVTLLAIWVRLPQEKDRQPWYRTSVGQLMIAFIVWFWVETAWALDRELNIAAAALLTKYLLVFYMVYRLIDTPGKTTGFLLAHVAGCFYLGLVAFGSDPSGRLDGVGGPGINDSNSLGMHLATGVTAASILALHLRGWRRYLCIASIAFSLNAIVLTGSRGAFLALLAGWLMLYYLRPPAYKKMFYAYAVLGIVLFGYVASNQFWKRMDTVTVAASDSTDMDTSSRARVEMFKAQMKMAPMCVLGCGHRASEILSTKYLDAKYQGYGGGRSSHNVFMTLLVEQGIPGVLIFLLIVRWTAASLRRLKRANAAPDASAEQNTCAVHAGAVGGALIVVLVGGIFADFSKCEVQIWMAALLAGLMQSPVMALTQAKSAGRNVRGPIPPPLGGAVADAARARGALRSRLT